MGEAGIRVHVDGTVARVVLARPDRRNPLSLDVIREMAGALAAVGRDEAVRVVVVEALGPAFSAGHDIREMVECDARLHEELFDACCDLMLSIHRVPQPVIAKVDGMATAAGCQLVASCDLAVASDRARFATPGVRIGLFCSTPMVALSRAVGRKRALEMLLTGEPIDAATAAEWGLVNRVVPVERLDEEVAALAATITRWSAHTVALGKSTFYRQVELPEEEAYELTRRVMAENAGHPVAQEGMSAFLEKREPVWPR